MERTKILFGSETTTRGDSQAPSKSKGANKTPALACSENSARQLIDLLKGSPFISRTELIAALKICNRAEINMAITSLLAQEHLLTTHSASTINASSSSSLTSLASHTKPATTNISSSVPELQDHKIDPQGKLYQNKSIFLNIENLTLEIRLKIEFFHLKIKYLIRLNLLCSDYDFYLLIINAKDENEFLFCILAQKICDLK